MAKPTIKVKNRKNGVFSYFTQKQWDHVQKNPMFDGVFIEQTPTTPPEVRKLEEKKKAQSQADKTVKQNTASTSENKVEGK